MVNNADWLMNLNYIDVLREVGACFSVNKMLSFECYKQRWERGLTFLEETIRKTLAPLCRGHVDVQLTLRRISGSDSDVTVDATLAAAYMQAANTP